MKTIVLIISILVSLVSLWPPANAGKRALVIGEEHYTGALPPLPGVSAESKSLAEKLASLGFDLAHGSAYTNLDKSALQQAISSFVASVKSGDVAIFSYDGHGAQLLGSNYLLPLGADPTMADTAINLDQEILKPLGETSASARLVLIDACRNVPLLAEQGLGRPSVMPIDAYVVFSVQPSVTVPNNSFFAHSLVEHIGEPGERIEDVIAEVTSDVTRETHNAQRPQTYGSMRSSIMLRPASRVVFHADRVDDNLYVTVDNHAVPDAQWALSQPALPDQTLELKKGPHPVLVEVYNRDSYTGGVGRVPGTDIDLGGHKPEGWYYSLRFTYGDKVLANLSDNEQEPQEHGPRHGKKFTVATLILDVNSHTGEVTASNLNPGVWKH
jgi:hypothetical protein